MKNQKGITLIAIVITIIVLLILAGITIAMLAGENGILTRAAQSKAYDEIAAAKDQLALKANETVAKYYDEKYVQSSTAVANPNDLQALVEAEMKGANVSSKNVTVSNVSADHKFTITCNNYHVEGEVGASGGITWGNITDQQ